ncbi:MAG: AAA family ATPase [Chloroflexi bacterium]|nr:AAA family ATPase [Chloroflexota bacterium]MBU1748103.1 AAA family ATPase [Chloroflexota bacterium]
MVLPPHIRAALESEEEGENLLEVVMDLGRMPEARFLDREVVLSDREVVAADIDSVVGRIGDFNDDNRAGIERTLHRVSAIRNRKCLIVGLTCRVGRAVYGTVDIIRDIIESGRSILLLGKPGIGKTTMLRETARILAERKRVVIVDTSNEIAGDGDIPHPAIGRARRMQVITPALQHAVMIEAVENHMPEVIVIDEIGTELEAAAARTIAERGVQLVGTAHGNTLENVMLNPTLADLVGGIQAVTLSDEVARQRGTQKTVLERKAPPTFDVVIEILDWDRLSIHHDVARAVDSILRGQPIAAEIRYRDEDTGEVLTERAELPVEVTAGPAEPRPAREASPGRTLQRLRVYPFGVSQNRLEQAAHNLNVPVQVVRDLDQASAVLTSRAYYRKRPKALRIAEARGIAVYVLRSNTQLQMEQFLADLYQLEAQPDPVGVALEEAQQAITQVLGGGRSIELAPQNAYVRRLQHQLAEQYHVGSRSRGKEPKRRVKIYAHDEAQRDE